jgi:hypothetical protein
MRAKIRWRIFLSNVWLAKLTCSQDHAAELCKRFWEMSKLCLNGDKKYNYICIDILPNAAQYSNNILQKER